MQLFHCCHFSNPVSLSEEVVAEFNVGDVVPNVEQIEWHIELGHHTQVSSLQAMNKCPDAWSAIVDR
jgi:hypothetical protein